MGRTVVALDVPMRVMTEAPWHNAMLAKNITPENRNLVFKWPGTQTFTLQPINFTPDFIQTDNWEALKYRLADVNYDANFVTEFPEQRNPVLNSADKHDWFFHFQVKNTNVPTGYPYTHTANLMTALSPQGNATLPAPALATDTEHIVALSSKTKAPANQGYMLRFFLEGRRSEKRSKILSFLFGEYSLSLHTNGMAELSMTVDGNNYALVYTFKWASNPDIHGKFHSLAIFPHCRNKIEFRSGVEYEKNWILGSVFGKNATAWDTNGVYVVPGEMVKDTNGNYVITQANNWSLGVSTEYRPFVQVSRLAFANGSSRSGSDTAGLYGNAQELRYPPSAVIAVAADYDTNGASVGYAVYDAISRAPFQYNGTDHNPIFAIGFHGIGDIPGNNGGLASSVTPEFYGYAMRKPAVFETTAGNSALFWVQSFQADRGRDPEGERATIILDNQPTLPGIYDGQVEAYTRRGEIPLVVGDYDTGVWFFEGTAYEVESLEAPGNEKRSLGLHCRGKADPLLTSTWIDAPDFGSDPNAEGNPPWYWNEAVRACFEAVGVPPEDVIIEDENLYKFRLWDKADSGGTGGDGSPNGHATNASEKGQSWKPLDGTFVYEFLWSLLHDTLGWTFCRDFRDRKYHVYKRPHPDNPLDAAKLTPKAIFVSDDIAYRQALIDFPGVPVYYHRQFKTRTARPECNSLIVKAWIEESGIVTKQDLTDLINLRTSQLQSGEAASDDEGLKTSLKEVSVYLENPNGFISAKHPNPDMTSVDYSPIGQKTHTLPDGALGSREALAYVSQLQFYDRCFGRLYGEFEQIGDWGDYVTAYLRKWDIVVMDSGKYDDGSRYWQPWFIMTMEPDYISDLNRDARFQACLYRNGIPPPN